MFRKTLDDLEAQHRKVRLWLRDDDAVVPSVALDRLLALTQDHQVPVTLAVIPKETGQPLVDRLAHAPLARVTVHGWSHHNYAPAGEKKQELGAHRPQSIVLAELKAGFDKLATLYPERFIPILVPPWNRLAPSLWEALPFIGFSRLSIFGREDTGSPILLVNTHVDIMDWRGTGGGRAPDALFAELADWIGKPDAPALIGILTHHLVHDEVAWDFLQALLAITSAHPACEWVRPDAS